jgi:hypothetical protein
MKMADVSKVLLKFLSKDFFPSYRKLWVVGVCLAIWLTLVLCLSIPEWSGIMAALKRLPLLVHFQFLCIVISGVFGIHWVEKAFPSRTGRNENGMRKNRKLKRKESLRRS